jgi:hypothetical protein
MKLRLPLFLLAATLGSVAALRADLDLSVIAEIRLGKALPPPPPAVEIIAEPAQKGPPPWAPAHGFRRNREYYFYPGANVYYRPADRTWFYLEGRDWRIGASLPTSVRVDFTQSVPLEMETDRPFQFHAAVTERYSSDYFTKKVKIKGASGKSLGKPEKSPGAAQGNAPGQGKGKGKDR